MTTAETEPDPAAEAHVLPEVLATQAACPHQRVPCTRC